MRDVCSKRYLSFVFVSQCVWVVRYDHDATVDRPRHLGVERAAERQQESRLLGMMEAMVVPGRSNIRWIRWMVVF